MTWRRGIVALVACGCFIAAAPATVAAPAKPKSPKAKFKAPPRALTKSAGKYVTKLVKKELPRNVSVRCKPTKANRRERGRWSCSWSAERRLTLYRSNACKATLRVTRRGGRWQKRTLKRRTCQVKVSPGTALVGYSEAWAFQRFGAERTAQLLADNGVQAHRLVIDWRSVEYRRGHIDWANPDAAVRALQARGVKVLLTVVSSPPWAADPKAPCLSGCVIPPATNHVADYAEFAAKVAARYPDAIGIEIWNEPNLRVFWSPQPDAGRFTQVLRASYDAIKKISPEMPVVAGGFGGLLQSDSSGIGLAQYLGQIYAAGAKGHMDAIGVHDYPYGLTDADLSYDLDAARGARNAAGDSATPLWITETGLSTTDTTRNGGRYVFSEGQQASGLVHIIARLRAEPDIEAIFIHTMVEQSPLPSFIGELGGYGVLHYNLARKPAYCAIGAYLGKPC